MGFSPGDFEIILLDNKSVQVHWEAKDRYIVLWYDNELGRVLTINYDQATECLQQLRTCIWSATGEDPI
jgi:hypothetical protein